MPPRVRARGFVCLLRTTEATKPQPARHGHGTVSETSSKLKVRYAAARPPTERAPANNL